jgi:hypothetical protein
MREFRLRQDVALDSPLRTNEERLDRRTNAHESARHRDPWIEMSARASAGKHDPRHGGFLSM